MDEDWFSHRVFGFELGEKLVDQLIDANVIKTLPDLYRLGLASLAALDRMGDKSAVNVVAALDKSKQTTLARFIYALGIRHVGETTAKLLARNYGTAEAFLKAMKEAAGNRAGEAFAELDNIEQIGPAVALAIADFFAEPHNVAVVDELLREVRPESLEAIDHASPISGKIVVFTGTLKRMTRLPLDCHLMIQHPERYVEAFAKAGATVIAVPLGILGAIYGFRKRPDAD